MALSITLDHAQNRYSRDRLGCALIGSELIGTRFSSNVIQEPVKGSIILRPYFLTSAWNTSSPSGHGKLGLSDFTVLTGGATLTEADMSGGGYRKYLSGLKNVDFITNTTWAKNTPWCVSLFSYSAGGDAVLLEMGWGATASIDGCALRLYASGRIEFFRNGALYADGKVSGSKGPDMKPNQLFDLVIMPAFRKELLIWSKGGDGFSVVYSDIDDDASSPEILPSAKVWFRQPDVSTMLMAAPLRFPTSGYAVSNVFGLAEAPDSLDTRETFDNETWAGGTGQNYRIYGSQSYRTGNTDSASVTILETDGSTTFTPDGIKDEVLIKTSLAGDGYSTPCVYGSEVGYATVATDTDDSEEQDITDLCLSCSLTVPDGLEGAQLTVEIKNGAGGAPVGLTTQFNRPILAKLGDVEIFDGRTGTPSRVRAKVEEAERIQITALDLTKALKKYMFRERKPLDGMPVCKASSDRSAVRFLLSLVGVPTSKMNLENFTTVLGEVAPTFASEWSEVADTGALASEVLSRLFEDVLGGSFAGVRPSATGIEFVVESKATVDAKSAAHKLWWSTADAVAGLIVDGMTESEAKAAAYRHVARGHKVSIVESEVNEVIVQGYDPRTNTAILKRKKDGDSQDPTLAPSDRPSNWHGEPSRGGVTSKGLTTQDGVRAGLETLFDRASVTRQLHEIECEFMVRSNNVPVWRGDKIWLDGFGDLLIQSFHAEFEKEPESGDTWQWRPAQYVLSNVMGETGGRSLREIEMRHRDILLYGSMVLRRNAGQLPYLVRSSAETVS